jgi:hypothetical protein
MTIVGMVLMTLLWLGSLPLAYFGWFATIMMTDAGGRSSLEDVLVMVMIVIASLYFVVTIGAVIVAWIAFALAKVGFARNAILAPLVNIAAYLVVYVILAAHQPAWRPW